MNKIMTLFALVFLATSMAACGSSYKTSGGEPTNQSLDAQAWQTVSTARAKDPSLGKFFDGAAGYAVFPEIAKGGAGIGGAHGEGVVIEGANIIGYTDVKQATIGFQLGGQVYAMIIFFQNDDQLTIFKSGNYEFAAQATAVALDKGRGANADYDGGIAVFTMGEKGLMYEATIGGQKFSYVPK